MLIIERSNNRLPNGGKQKDDENDGKRKKLNRISEISD
mgnify:FL=1